MGVKVPKIRFKGFAEEWEERGLGNICNSTGGTSIESEFNSFGCFKVISIGSYSLDSVYIDQGIRVSSTSKIQPRILSKGNLTMILNDKTASGNIIGRVLLIDSDNAYVYNQRTQRLEIKQELYDSTFLYHMLNADNIRNKIVRSAQGNTQIYVNWTAVERLLYCIPCLLSEQTQIGTFFKTLDRLITCHRSKHEKLLQVKKAMLEKMFPKHGEKVPEIRFRGFDGDWEEKELGSFADTYSGGTPSVYKSAYYGGCIPFIRSGEISSITTELFLTDEGLINSSAKIVCFGDILYALYGATSGEVSISAITGAINQAILAIKLPSNYNNYFVSYWLRKEKQTIVNTYLQGGQGNLSGSIVKGFQIFFPNTYAEQAKIGIFFKTLDDLIANHQRELDKLTNMKKALLEKMFV